jgi:hypothetical protein
MLHQPPAYTREDVGCAVWLPIAGAPRGISLRAPFDCFGVVDIPAGEIALFLSWFSSRWSRSFADFLGTSNCIPVQSVTVVRACFSCMISNEFGTTYDTTDNRSRTDDQAACGINQKAHSPYTTLFAHFEMLAGEGDELSV